MLAQYSYYMGLQSFLRFYISYKTKITSAEDISKIK